MLNADSNADFVKLYQTSLPTQLHLTSTEFLHTKVQVYSVLTSRSLSIYTVCDNKERENSFYEIIY